MNVIISIAWFRLKSDVCVRAYCYKQESAKCTWNETKNIASKRIRKEKLRGAKNNVLLWFWSRDGLFFIQASDSVYNKQMQWTWISNMKISEINCFASRKKVSYFLQRFSDQIHGHVCTLETVPQLSGKDTISNMSELGAIYYAHTERQIMALFKHSTPYSNCRIWEIAGNHDILLR